MCRRRVNDAAPAFFFHVRQGQARRVKAGCQVQTDDQIPFFDRKLFDRRNMLNACIVHQNIHAAERLISFSNHGFNLISFGQVGTRIKSLDAMLFF